MGDITDIVAIDGPAGAGKSTAARAVARTLGIAYLDTGAMYRAATWFALDNAVDLDNPNAVTASTNAMKYEVREEQDGFQRIFVNGEDVTDLIRTPDVTRNIYKLDQNPRVRERLVELQRRVGAGRTTVAEGRDIGTVVFPKAKCKIYLDASLEERARRRAAELEARGLPVDLDVLRREIDERDTRDRNRAVSPLRRAGDATVLDTTDKDLDQVVQCIVALARERL